MDLVFYDPTISYEETLQIEQELKKTYPQYAWEVKNQVYMHQHSPGTAPYRSACDAVSKYPEQCTALAVRLRKDGQLELFLPYGTNTHFQISAYYQKVLLKIFLSVPLL